MPNLYDLYETDQSRERDGVEVPLSGAIFTLARAGGSNAAYGRAFDEETRDVRREMDLKMLDAKKDREIFARVYARAVVKGWKNVTDREGKEMPFSVDACVKLFTDLPDLFADVREAANRLATFRAERQKADAGN